MTKAITAWTIVRAILCAIGIAATVVAGLWVLANLAEIIAFIIRAIITFFVAIVTNIAENGFTL